VIVVIEVKNLSFKFGEKQIFNNFNYTFEDGKIYSVMGKSGCGKSTLLRIIAGLQKFDVGEILYNGKKVHHRIPDLFMMHQGYTNFPWKTALQNVLMPLKYNDGRLTTEEVERAKNIMERVGLGDCVDSYPHELSGGMRQRVALARVLVTNPKVILMDEPLSALDPATRISMQDLVLEEHRRDGDTIIMITHDPVEAQRMSDVIVNL
jgi:ABC-type nitrate/sulfonate/bicarbonate transport system ATPase subunit